MTPSARRARRQDVRVNLAAHPFAWVAARAVRALGPVVRVPGLGVVVNAAEVGHDVLVRDDLFTKQGPGSIAAIMTRAFGASALANMDGEAHRALRQRLGPLAAPELAAAWFAAARAPLDKAAVALEAGRVADLTRASRALAGRLTLAMLGLDLTDDARALEIHALGVRIAATLRLSPFGRSREAAARADTDRLVGLAHAAFFREDLPASSLVARVKALGCDAEETRGLLSIFLVAGAVTLGVALPRVAGLLIDVGRLHRLADDGALRAAVEEGLRYSCPIPATLRIASRETFVGPVRVRAGERVVVLTANLGRDPALFPDPDRFDPDRPPEPRARYLWYGAGAHFCLGFALAQHAMLQAIGRLARVPGPLRVVRRRAARGVLLPAWDLLEVAPGGGR